MPRRRLLLPLAILLVAAAFVLQATAPPRGPEGISARASLSASTDATTDSPSASWMSAQGTPLPDETPIASLPPYRAPAIEWPLPELDPGLVMRARHPTPAQLAGWLSGDPRIVGFDPAAPETDWRIARPALGAVAGFADTMSVVPGGSFGLHLAGNDRIATVRIFRLGAGDAEPIFERTGVPVAPLVVPEPDGATGLDAMPWPVSLRVDVGSSWRSGVYLAKLSAPHGQSYVVFVVREPHPSPLTVVVPMMTWEAYNSWNGVSLYHREPPRPDTPTRGYAVSFDRPFAYGAGAGLLFRSAYPLIVWLEDHGYAPGYVADADLASHPEYATETRTVVIAGHAEYWTRSMRDALSAAEGRGVGVAAFGANLVFRQVRLEPDALGTERTIVCYKDAALDPHAGPDGESATVEFATLPRPLPASELFGAEWLGALPGPTGLRLTDAVVRFAPDAGFARSATVPFVLGGEIDRLVDGSGLELARTAARDTSGRHVAPTSSVWVSPTGAHVFDAGTFAWAWGLDPRYAAGLEGFPREAFSRLTASILAWAGAQPTR